MVGFQSTDRLPWGTPEQGTLVPASPYTGCPLLHWVNELNAERNFPTGINKVYIIIIIIIIIITTLIFLIVAVEVDTSLCIVKGKHFIGVVLLDWP